MVRDGKEFVNAAKKVAAFLSDLSGLDVEHVLVHVLCRPDHLGIGLVGGLGGDHIDKFLGHVDVRWIKGFDLDAARPERPANRNRRGNTPLRVFGKITIGVDVDDVLRARTNPGATGRQTGNRRRQDTRYAHLQNLALDQTAIA